MDTIVACTSKSIRIQLKVDKFIVLFFVVVFIFLVTTIMSTVCLCVWPNFINTLIKFIGQCKVKESKSTKWWKRRQSKRKSTLEILSIHTSLLNVVL